MTKRSAITFAAGLVPALVAGAAAFSLSFGAPTVPAAAGTKAKPIIRTQRRTVTVHKKAKRHAGQARVITIGSGGGSSVCSSSGYGDDSYGDDDGYEHESEDHSGSEDSYGGGGSEGDD